MKIVRSTFLDKLNVISCCFFYCC